MCVVYWKLQYVEWYISHIILQSKVCNTFLLMYISSNEV